MRQRADTQEKAAHACDCVSRHFDTRVNTVNADQVIAQWGETNACLAAENSEAGFALTEKIVGGKWREVIPTEGTLIWEPDARLLMEKWLVQGLGHAWSGSPRPSKYGDPKGPNASAEIWRFFCEAGSDRVSSL